MLVPEKRRCWSAFLSHLTVAPLKIILPRLGTGPALGRLTANLIASAVHKKNYEKVSFKSSRSCGRLVATKPECPSALGPLSSLWLLASSLLAPWLLVCRELASWVLVSRSGYSGRPVLTVADCQPQLRSSGADRRCDLISRTIRAAGFMVSTRASLKVFRPVFGARELAGRKSAMQTDPSTLHRCQA
jgi:hypothetical protein